MQAGNLRKRITLQKRVGTRDAWGQLVNSWQDIAPIWAEVEMVSGKEGLHGLQVESSMSCKVTVRYRPELADPRQVNAWRFVFDGRTLNIGAMLYADMKKRYCVLLCDEGLNDGT